MSDRDAQILAAAIARDFSQATPRITEVDSAAPPVRVIDCVLSLNRKYLRVVEPRVLRFLREHPDLQTCEQLRAMIVAEGPSAFLRQHLATNDADRARVLLRVTEKVIELQRHVEGDTELARLERWATEARPREYAAFGVWGFGISGFQYLRILFGANTTKPDVHIQAYVARIVGRRVPEITSIELLEEAVQIAGLSLRTTDSAIWQKGAIRSGPAPSASSFDEPRRSSSALPEASSAEHGAGPIEVGDVLISHRKGYHHVVTNTHGDSATILWIERVSGEPRPFEHHARPVGRRRAPSDYDVVRKTDVDRAEYTTPTGGWPS